MKVYSHIKIDRVPQKLDEDFVRNMTIADQQKKLAEAAPDLLAALQGFQAAWEENRLLTSDEAAAARAAIAKATA